MKFKVGDKIYCYRNDSPWGEDLFTVGRYYIITDVEDDRFYILCDEIFSPTYLYLEQYYDDDDDDIRKYYYYKLYFTNICEERKFKLEKLRGL